MTADEITEAEIICFHVNNMIKDTFEILAEIYKTKREGKTNNVQDSKGCRLIFPHYSPKDGKERETRISEQELRFAFVEAFNRYCTTHEGLQWFYSIETPTMKKYRFSENKKNIYPKIDNTGQSANFDFVIHDHKLKRICLIEFKALNSNWHEHHKDFFKLIKDHIIENSHNALDPHYYPYTQRYFIEVLASYDNETWQNLASKKIKLEDDKIELEETERKVGKEIATNIINYTDSVKESNIKKIRFCCFSLKLNPDEKDKDAPKDNITNKIIPPSK